MYVRVLAVALTAMVLHAGCATYHARSSAPYIRRPRVYPATRYTWQGQDGLFDRYWPGTDEPGPFQPDGRSMGRAIVVSISYLAGMAVYAAVVETPVSLVTDTLLWPYDLKRVRMAPGHDGERRVR